MVALSKIAVVPLGVGFCMVCAVSDPLYLSKVRAQINKYDNRCASVVSLVFTALYFRFVSGRGDPRVRRKEGPPFKGITVIIDVFEKSCTENALVRGHIRIPR